MEAVRLEKSEIDQPVRLEDTRAFEMIGSFCLGASSIVGGVALGIGFGAAGGVIGGLLGAAVFALTKVKRRGHA
jgi:hypothetical protein